MDYDSFISSKRTTETVVGHEPGELNGSLFGFQRAIVQWAVRRGRAAIFADTGLGKTLMQVSWADEVAKHTGGKVLILAPLCVAQQTVLEAERFGVSVAYRRDGSDLPDGITITNYEMAKAFDFSQFAGVVLDESSILKSYMGKTKQFLIDSVEPVRYRLACTATPSPNDFLELGNHAEFLGVMPSNEMIMRFFINDTMNAGGYRLKNHARGDFWRWVASWAMCISKPSDLGYSDDGYDLPEMKVNWLIVAVDDLPASDGQLFRSVEMSATSVHAEGRITCERRADAIAAVAAGISSEPFLVWCNTNYEADAVKSRVFGSVECRGSDTIDQKERALSGFSGGAIKTLITKPSIAGFGMNWQHCANMAFVGLSYSYEDYYQAIRRCWRFGQKREVNVYIACAESETAILETIKRKEIQHMEMKKEMVATISQYHRGVEKNDTPYFGAHEGIGYTVHHGDCVHVAQKIESDSVGYSVFSPPFSNLYIYSDSDYDMGNCANDVQFLEHFRHLVREMLRITKNGRLCSVHCKDLPRYKGRDGAAGLSDFPGMCIRLFEQEGWQYHSRVTIWKDPVIEMQRTKNHGLLYKQLCKDSAASRQGMADYIITFRKWTDAENFDDPVTTGGERFCDYKGMTQCQPAARDIGMARSDEERKRLYSISVWQRYASPVWFDINQTNVLNYQLGKDGDDEKHICPLQLDVIERCVELWSNPGDLVYSPFTGIGSEGFVSVKMGRRFVGSELKEGYFKLACKNVEDARKEQCDLFAAVP